MDRLQLPKAPDFAAIEKAASTEGQHHDEFLRLTGILTLVWSNNESMLIYILMILLEIDEASAAVIFSSLNTTRARIELVNRLSAVRLRDQDAASSLSRLIKRLEVYTRIRNELGHSTYSLNEKGQITHTHLLKLILKGQNLKIGETRPVTQDRIEQLNDALRQLKRLNRDLWSFLPLLQTAMKKNTAAAKFVV